MTEQQKHIYNLFLSATAKANNRPFKYRKNWDEFEQSPEFGYIKSLESIFVKYPHFYSEDYFIAPYKIYGQDTKQYFPLKYYASYKGIQDCTSFLNLRRLQSPAEQKDFIRDSFKFVYDFCIEHKIPLCEYARYKSISQYDCIIHLKTHKISWYLVFAIPGMRDTLYQLPVDEFELYFGEKMDLNTIHNQLFNDQKMSKLLPIWAKKVERAIAEFLSSSKN